MLIMCQAVTTLLFFMHMSMQFEKMSEADRVASR